MGCWWALEGTIKPQNGHLGDVAKILTEYGCELSGDSKAGTLSLSFSGERGYSFTHDIARELAPLLLEGKIDAHGDDTDSYYRYSFRNGICRFCVGESLIWFRGYEDEFVESLPDKIIQAVLEKFTEKCDCNHDCDALYRKGREDALREGNRDDR